MQNARDVTSHGVGSGALLGFFVMALAMSSGEPSSHAIPVRNE
jgi:hypothetical protein